MGEEPLLREDVVIALWAAYTKTAEYKSGSTKAIAKNHALVLNTEVSGLRRIYINFIDSLKEGKFRREEVRHEKPSDWLAEIKSMHDVLFKYALRSRGKWRKTDVRFGTPGDEDEAAHRIPLRSKVSNEMDYFAEHLTSFCQTDYSNNPDDLFTELAKIHYRFIRIHPFKDGNGRIARAITDQLAVLNGFPPAMGGYPRLDVSRRNAYHKSITACIEDRECKMLAGWIRNYFDQQMKSLA